MRGASSLAVLAAVAVGALLQAGGVCASRSSAPSTCASTSAGRTTRRTTSSSWRWTSATLDADPNAAVPFNRRRHARVIRAPDRGRRAGDRLRRAVHRAELVPGGRRGADRGGARLATGRPRDHRGRGRRLDADLRRRGRARVQPRHAANSNVALDDDGVAAPHALRARAARDVRDGRRAPQDRPPDRHRRRATTRGSTTRARPARSTRLSFVDVEYGRFAPAAVRGKVVVVGATRGSSRISTTPRPATTCQGPRSTPRPIATALRGFPLERGAGLGRLAAARGARRRRLRSSRARFGTAMGLGAGRVAVLRSSSSAPSSPSGRTSSSPSCRRSRPRSPASSARCCSPTRSPTRG